MRTNFNATTKRVNSGSNRVVADVGVGVDEAVAAVTGGISSPLSIIWRIQACTLLKRVEC